jgi:hypothetical protein
MSDVSRKSAGLLARSLAEFERAARGILPQVDGGWAIPFKVAHVVNVGFRRNSGHAKTVLTHVSTEGSL